jgi:hypothetical protein
MFSFDPKSVLAQIEARINCSDVAGSRSGERIPQIVATEAPGASQPSIPSIKKIQSAPCYTATSATTGGSRGNDTQLARKPPATLLQKPLSLEDQKAEYEKILRLCNQPGFNLPNLISAAERSITLLAYGLRNTTNCSIGQKKSALQAISELALRSYKSLTQKK